MKKYFLKIRAFTLMGILVLSLLVADKSKQTYQITVIENKKILALVNQN